MVARFSRPGATLTRPSGVSTPSVSRNSMARAVEKCRPFLLVVLIFSAATIRSEEHTSELQSLMRNSYAVFCLKKKKKQYIKTVTNAQTLSHNTLTHKKNRT